MSPSLEKHQRVSNKQRLNFVLVLYVSCVFYTACVSCMQINSFQELLSATRRHYYGKNSTSSLTNRNGGYGQSYPKSPVKEEPTTGVGWAAWFTYPAQARGYGITGAFPALQPGYGGLSFENYAVGFYSPQYTGYLNQGYGSSSGYRPISDGGGGGGYSSGYGGGGQLGYRSNAYNQPQRQSRFFEPVRENTPYGRDAAYDPATPLVGNRYNQRLLGRSAVIPDRYSSTQGRMDLYKPTYHLRPQPQPRSFNSQYVGQSAPYYRTYSSDTTRRMYNGNPSYYA